MGALQILVVSVLLGILTRNSNSEKLSFRDHRVCSVFIQNEDQLDTLQALEATPNLFTFLDVPSAINSKVQIVVPPAKQRYFENLVQQLKLVSHVDSYSLQSVIDNERPNQSKRAAFGWTDYYTLEEMYAWIDELVPEHSDVLSVETIGQSYEGRDLKVVKLSHKEGNPGIFVDANIHAREWITSATVTWILNELLTSEDPAFRDLAENFDWYIVPVLNPDGFVYTHTTDRLWRKTRYPYNILCYGADPNRNFDFQWNNGGASMNPCSDAYAGQHPESEVEVKVVSDYIRSIAGELILYLTIHSKGQYILVPFGYENAPYPPTYQDLMQIGRRGAVDMYNLYQKPYRVGTSSDVLYVASGISVDWAYGAVNIPLSYTFELRDQGEFGWILPADQIIPNAEELLAAFVGMVDEAHTVIWGESGHMGWIGTAVLALLLHNIWIFLIGFG